MCYILLLFFTFLFFFFFSFFFFFFLAKRALTVIKRVRVTLPTALSRADPFFPSNKRAHVSSKLSIIFKDSKGDRTIKHGHRRLLG